MTYEMAPGTSITPGHPLYAQVAAEHVIGEALGNPELGMQLVNLLVRHDPPIYLCTADELRS